jgi:hypothetical protein
MKPKLSRAFADTACLYVLFHVYRGGLQYQVHSCSDGYRESANDDCCAWRNGFIMLLGSLAVRKCTRRADCGRS